jgi:hypothetical protein
MITPEQMLQEAIEEINSLSIDELEAMFREAGFDLVSKEPEDYASLPNEMTTAEWVDPVTLTLSLTCKFAMNDEFLDIAA